ncbi:MAG: hypothetical protein MUE81_14205 [Thermoflexibacter sp.]|jgi:hypothetical protein|nr:hypothetical protein [Thermoflexibacter sp.]
MKNLYFTFLLLLWVRGSILAQAPIQGVDAQNNINTLGGNYAGVNTVRVFDERYKGVKGTACVFDKWYPTDIYLTNGAIHQKILAKLDVYKGQDLVVLRKDKGDSMIVKYESIKSFVIENTDANKQHVFAKFQVGENKTSEFCEVLHQGKFSLIAYRTKTLLPADYQGAYNAGRYYDEFLPNTELFIVTPDNQIIKLKKSKKALLKILNQSEKEFVEYIEKNKIDFEKEGDIANAVAFYNNLSNK